MADFRIVEFYTQYRAGRDPVDWVVLAPPGEAFLKTQSKHRISKMIPPKDADEATRDSLHYKFMEHRWSIIEPAYRAWKDGEELPETGTPLAAWGGVSPDMAKALQSMALRTVEDVRDNPEAVAKLNFPNARKLSETAGAFLESQDVAEKDEQIAEMKERMAAMEEMLAEATKPKRGTGRPKKAEAEAA